MAVYIHPPASEETQHLYPEVLYVFLGDFNHCNLKTVLPKHITKAYYFYFNLKNAFHRRSGHCAVLMLLIKDERTFKKFNLASLLNFCKKFGLE